MKVLMILFLIFSSNLYAGPTKVGNGDEGADLEGFDLVAKGKLIETKQLALKLLNRLNTQGIIGLGNLIPEVENAKIYITKKNINSQKLEELGAFHSGPEGFVYARTFPRSYAPTRFFPVALSLSNNQLMALHIHEALHRALPKSVNENETVITKITLAIISPEQSSDSIQAVVKEEIPDLFKPATPEVAINKNSKLKRPSLIDLAYSQWSATSRKKTPSSQLPLHHSFDMGIQFYPFGTEKTATGFGINTSYLHTKRSENYLGPLELVVRNLFWTDKGYDLEVKAGAQFMSASNSKVINSVYGRDAILFGIDIRQVRDFYKFNVGLDVMGHDKYNRALEGVSREYKVGSLLDLNGNILFLWKDFEFGGHGSLLSLGALRVRENNTTLLDKDRDQYVSAGPDLKYRLNEDIALKIKGDYLFNSNNSDAENHVRDLFGNGLGQWKWSLGTEILL